MNNVLEMSNNGCGDQPGSPQSQVSDNHLNYSNEWQRVWRKNDRVILEQNSWEEDGWDVGAGEKVIHTE